MSHAATVARISKNTIMLYGAYAVRKISVFFLAVLIAREAGRAGFGVYCLALVMMELGISISIFGTDILIIRDVSAGEKEAAKLAGNALLWRFAASILVCPVLVGLAAAISHDALLPGLVATMCVGMIATSLGDVYLSMVQGRERVDLHAYVMAGTNIAGLALGAGALHLGYGIPGVACAYSLRGLFNLVAGLLTCRAQGQSVTPQVNFRFMGATLKKAAPIAANRLLTIIYLGSGLAVLEGFYGSDAVGQFSGSLNLFEACAAFGMLTMVAAFPTLSRLTTVDKVQLRRTVETIVRFFWWVGFPLSILVALHAESLLGLVFGSEFTPYGKALVVLMAAVPFSLNFVLIERLAYAHNDRVRVFVIRCVGTLVSLGVLFGFLKRTSYLAPAQAILAAEMVMFTLFLPQYRRYTGGSRFILVMFPPLAASIISLALALAVAPHLNSPRALPFVAAFLLAAAIYRALQRPRDQRPR